MPKRREKNKVHFPFDATRYAPDFSEAEHEGAREEGYEDATERWAVHLDIRMEDFYHRSVHEQGKASRRASLESIGVPFEKLGALADAANRLPQSPDYEEPEISVPKNDYQRRAAIHGLKNRLLLWMDACERDGLVPGAELCPDGMEFRQYLHREREGEEIRARLEAMGTDFDETLEQAEAGEIVYEEPFAEEPESDDPEIRRVLREYEEEKKRSGTTTLGSTPGRKRTKMNKQRVTIRANIWRALLFGFALWILLFHSEFLRRLDPRTLFPNVSTLDEFQSIVAYAIAAITLVGIVKLISQSR